MNNEVVKTKEQSAEELGLVVPKNMGDYVNNTMQKYIERGLTVPSDYNVNNAVISSYLLIQKDEKLKACSQQSIASALIDMAVMGLSASKNQCYFIARAGQCCLDASYFGKIMAIKRIKGVIDVVADVIYKDTSYELSTDEFGNDNITIVKPCDLDKRLADNIIGAWCKIILDENVWGRKTHTCIMTLDQIHKSWNQGSAKGKSPAHVNFPEEMAKKSVINRCCKNFVNSAKDQDILIETINRTTANDYKNIAPMQSTINEEKVIDI